MSFILIEPQFLRPKDYGDFCCQERINPVNCSSVTGPWEFTEDDGVAFHRINIKMVDGTEPYELWFRSMEQVNMFLKKLEK